MPTREELQGGFSIGEWEVLPARGILRRGDEEIRPENKPFLVLLALAQRDGDLVTNEELIDEVWDGRAQSDEPILRCISLLRRHFGDQRPYKYIENVPRRGYRVCPPVELHAARASKNEPGVEEGRSLGWWKAVVATMALAFAAVVPWMWLTPPPPPASLAVLPVDNLSGDPANQYIAEGIHRALGQRLSELPDRTIKIIRTPQKGDWASMRRRLGVESLLIASVQIEKSTLKVDYQVIDDDDVVILGGKESGSVDNLFGLQERVARAIHRALADAQAPALIERMAPDSVAYNSYVRGMYMLEHRFKRSNLEESIRLFQESIAMDESYGPAYLGLATAYALLPDYRDKPWQEHLELALATIDKGVSMDPSIADPAGAIYGFVYYQRKEWSKAENAYARAINSPVVDSNAFSWYSQMLASVGRLHDARDVALDGEEIDPDSTVVNSRVAMIYTWLGNAAKAHEFFARANDLDATGIIHDMAHVLLLTRSGKTRLAQELTFAAAKGENASTDWIEPVFRGLEDPQLARTGLDAINRAWEARQVIPHIVVLARSLLGDVDGAMEIAWLLDQPGETFSMELLYIDELAPLRQHADFMPLLESLGVVDYWQQVGCRWEDDRVVCSG